MKPVKLAPPIKIWYKPLPKLPKIPWPILDINLSYKNNGLPQPILSLIDSGANSSILHLEVAEALGFNLKNLEIPQTKGISASGFYKSWLLPEPVNINIYGFCFYVKFTVIANPDLIWPCILGGDSIFEKSRVDFHKFKGYFELSFRTDIN